MLGHNVVNAALVPVKVTITNLAPANGASLSPIFVGAQDGTFSSFTSGNAAGAGIKTVAELAATGTLASEFTASQPAGVQTTVTATIGGFGPGIYLPGASGSAILMLDPVKNRYLSYASMLVPSNDTFVGNASPTAVPLFDAGGNFIAQDFSVLGKHLWDAGSEVNGVFGSAFIVGINIADRVAENGVVTPIDPTTQFTPYLGASTPAGYSFTLPPGANDGVVSFAFQVVPEPASLSLVGCVAAFAMSRRRR